MVCDQFPGDTESFSNRFAASVLVPEDEFLEILKDKKRAGIKTGARWSFVRAS